LPFAPGKLAFAQTAEFRLKYGTAFPVDHPGAVRIKEAAEAIKNETNGRVELLVFPNGQLGSEPDMFAQTRSGALESMSTSGVNLTTVPVGGINAVAFAFNDYGQVWAAMDGELGAHVRAAFEKANLHLFEKVLDNGFRNMTSSVRPINAPGDLKGLKIRVPSNQLWVSMFKALGAAPTAVNFNELYSALQTKIVDGQENPLALIDAAKFYEVQKYCSLTGHMWEGFWMVANRRNFEQLPPDLRETTVRLLNEGAVKQRDDMAKLNVTLEAQLKQKGLTFNTVNKKPFQEALKAAGFYAEWRGKFGDDAWKTLERYSGALS
jgi:tripartite ATP-independent transporter DctP family solute receptor